MNRIHFIKYTAFSLELVLCFVLQSLPGFRLEVFGGTPVLLLPLVMTIAVYEREIPAIVFGVAGGLLADGGYSGPMGYYAITMAILCYVVSILMEQYIRTSLLTVMLVGTVSLPLVMFGQFVFFYVAMGYGNVWEYFFAHILSRIVYTWAMIPLFYALNRFIAVKTQQDS